MLQDAEHPLPPPPPSPRQCKKYQAFMALTSSTLCIVVCKMHPSKTLELWFARCTLPMNTRTKSYLEGWSCLRMSTSRRQHTHASTHALVELQKLTVMERCGRHGQMWGTSNSSRTYGIIRLILQSPGKTVNITNWTMWESCSNEA